MPGNTLPTQEEDPRVLTTSFEPVVVDLPPFLVKRIPVLSGPIEALEREPFVESGPNGELPADIEPVEGMSVPRAEEYDQVRGVKGRVVVKGEVVPEDAEATAITFRNSETLKEKAFAVAHDLATGEKTFMDRTIQEAEFHQPITDREVAAYGEAMSVVGSLATSGCTPTDPPNETNIPQELRYRGLSMLAPVEGEHGGGFKYETPGSGITIIYLHTDNFMDPKGGLGRNFEISIINEAMPVADLSGSTVIYLDPRPTELPPVQA